MGSPPQVVSLTDKLTAELQQLSQEASLGLNAAGVRALVQVVTSISSYREEGFDLYPELLVVTDMSSAIQQLPDQRVIWIMGAPAPLDSKALGKALKEAAPIAAIGWILALELGAEAFRLGVLSAGGELALSLPIDQLLFAAGPEPTIGAIYVRPTGHGRAEVASSTGKRLIVRFSALDDDAQSSRSIVERVALSATLDVAAELQEQTRSFWSNALWAGLRSCHGTLIAVLKTNVAFEVPPPLADGVWLSPPLDIAEAISSYGKGAQPSASVELARLRGFLTGILRGDGIVVLDTRSRILGFRVFVQSGGGPAPVGGARRRAFQALISAGGEVGLITCSFQSQDGHVDVWEKT